LIQQASGAMAQASLAPPPAKQAATATLEDIVVTAEKRTQKVQTLGGSVSVLSGKDLAAHNVNDIFDLQYQTPSLQVTPQFGSGQLEFAIRGVGFEDYASNNAPTVSLYIDEFAFPVTFGANGQIYDVQRVEVLRGPQGTLYGRNTTGGAVNYVLNRPTRDLTGSFTLQEGRFGSTLLEGDVSGSVAHDVQIRLAGETQQGGAWQHGPYGRMLGNTDRSSLRMLLDWEPTDTLTIEANLHGSHDRSDALGTHLYAPNTALDEVGRDVPPTPVDPDRDDTMWGTSSLFAKEIGIEPETKPFSHIDTAGVNLRADQVFDAGRLSDLISYDYAGRQEYDDFDALPLALADVYFNTRANVFANELRLTSNTAGPLTYLAGIYYAHQYLADIYRGGFDQIYGVDTAVRYSQFVNTISGFGQVSARITDALTFTGGLRLEHEERNLDNFGSFVLVGGRAINPDNMASQSTSYTKPSGKLELQYTPFANDMIYGEVSEGLKSGGFTTYNAKTAAVGTAPFQPEELLAYELGNKLEIPAVNLRLNLASFYYDYHNEQIQAAVLNATTGLVGSIVNAPRSHLFGGEIEITWSPLPGLTLAQSAAEATGAFDEFSSLQSATNIRRRGTPDFVGVYLNRAGEALPAPKFTANGSISYRKGFDRYAVTFDVDYSLRTTYNSLFGSLYDVSGYTLLNAHMSFGPNDGIWMITLYGQNILNKHYDIDRNYFVAGDDIATAGLPATYGVRATANF
jgi:outer membrane receptor protein involved in Fe transport